MLLMCITRLSSASNWIKFQPVRNTTQIKVMRHHQFWNFCAHSSHIISLKTNDGVVKFCQFCQVTSKAICIKLYIGKCSKRTLYCGDYNAFHLFFLINST